MTVIWGKIHHHLSFIMTCNDCNLGQNPDLVPEKSINIPHQTHTLTLQEPSPPSTYPNQQSLQF